jgi:hypothetical protein
MAHTEPMTEPPEQEIELKRQFERLHQDIRADVATMNRARWAWKLVAAGLATGSVTAPTLVASGVLPSSGLVTKVVLLTAAIFSGLYAFFRPGELAQARRVDFARAQSLLRRLELEWNAVADAHTKVRWELLRRFGAEFDRQFEARGSTLLESKLDAETHEPSAPISAPARSSSTETDLLRRGA